MRGQAQGVPPRPAKLRQRNCHTDAPKIRLRGATPASASQGSPCDTPQPPERRGRHGRRACGGGATLWPQA
eukprot:6962827-Alexandrium_andersonii.AAC.1